MLIFTLTLIRHAETSYNREKILQGQFDCPLSETGIVQAQLLGQRMQHESYTHVYCSDLSRTKTTCKLLLDKNKFIKENIKNDSRLRERKFGIYENRPVSEFTNDVSKHKKSCENEEFIPPGGESIEQFRERVRDFFHDLCSTMSEFKTGFTGLSESPLSGDSASSDRSPSILFTDDQPISNITRASNSTRDDLLKSDTNAPSRTGSTSHASSGSTSSGCSSMGGSDESVPHARTVTVPSTISFDDGSFSPSHSPCSSSSSGACTDDEKDAGLRYSSACGLDDQTLPLCTPPSSLLSPASDCLQTTKQGCPTPPPNVSLSPIYEYHPFKSPSSEHRLCSISSVSSGRNDSFDEDIEANRIRPSDSSPPSDVLVVTHGGVIRELVSYFCEQLSCRIPGGHSAARTISPNTGVSRFLVTLQPGETKWPKVTCLSLYDKDHLYPMT